MKTKRFLTLSLAGFMVLFLNVACATAEHHGMKDDGMMKHDNMIEQDGSKEESKVMKEGKMMKKSGKTTDDKDMSMEHKKMMMH